MLISYFQQFQLSYTTNQLTLFLLSSPTLLNFCFFPRQDKGKGKLTIDNYKYKHITAFFKYVNPCSISLTTVPAQGYSLPRTDVKSYQ